MVSNFHVITDIASVKSLYSTRIITEAAKFTQYVLLLQLHLRLVLPTSTRVTDRTSATTSVEGVVDTIVLPLRASAPRTSSATSIDGSKGLVLPARCLIQ